jgi:signal transduction histidine kinase
LELHDATTRCAGALCESGLGAVGSRRHARGGEGLGLFIAEQIVEAHGGEIAVRSQRGQTTFTVRLPQTRRA